MILETAINHFHEDIHRARVLINHSATVTDSNLMKDIMRSSWMMAVGSLDAYFCDAYGDLVARTFRAKVLQSSIPIPSRLSELKIPAVVVLDNDLNSGWLWRMVARDLIEKDNVLSIGKIRELFGQFFPDNEKILNANGPILEKWILHSSSQFRLFGVRKTDCRSASPSQKNAIKKKALAQLEERFGLIFQRRHDCIHNCDRPKIAIQDVHITLAYIRKVIDDIQFLVERCHEEFKLHFPLYLHRLGFNPVTRNRVGA
jgi:hypothetical protein